MAKPTAYQKAIAILARRDHSVREVRDKLSRDYSESEIDESIDRLIQDKYLSESRFIESFLRSRLSLGQGPVKILHEFGQKGIDKEQVEACDDWHNVDFSAIAREVRVKRFGHQPPKDFKEKQKQSAFLSRRGFFPEQIKEAFNDEDHLSYFD